MFLVRDECKTIAWQASKTITIIELESSNLHANTVEGCGKKNRKNGTLRHVINRNPCGERRSSLASNYYPRGRRALLVQRPAAKEDSRLG